MNTQLKPITLRQFQKLHAVSTDNSLSDFDRQIKIIGACYGLSDEEVDNLSLKQFQIMSNYCNALDFSPSETFPKILKGGKRKYKVNYDLTGFTLPRLKRLHEADPNDMQQAHRNLALLVYPVNWFGIRTSLSKNGDIDEGFEFIAQDLLEAKIIDVVTVMSYFPLLLKRLEKYN